VLPAIVVISQEGEEEKFEIQCGTLYIVLFGISLLPAQLKHHYILFNSS
jgi:hypothetical protein